MEVYVYFKECKNIRENLWDWSGFIFYEECYLLFIVLSCICNNNLL